VGAALFGAAVGAFDLLTGPPGRRAAEVIVQAPLTVLWGVTITGFWIVLWPLSVLNHRLILGPRDD
jgi:hypothetical protein